MNEFQVAQLIHLVIVVDADDEVQRCVPSVEHFILSMVQEGALNERLKVKDYLAFCTRKTLSDKLTLQGHLLLNRERVIVF